MKNASLLVPYDLSAAGDKAIVYAGFLASNLGWEIEIFHLDDEADTRAVEISGQISERTKELLSLYNSPFQVQVQHGSIFSDIARKADEVQVAMAVMGTHGARGLRQKWFGADILKIVKEMPVPVLVVQEDTVLPQGNSIRKILFPVGGHAAFQKCAEAVCFIAKQFQAEVILYSIERPGFPYSDTMKHNIEQALNLFAKEGVTCNRVKEEVSVISIGFAKQTLDFAKANHVDMIAVVSESTQENYYFAPIDKENLLTNPFNIPVLCTGSGEKEI